MIVHGYLTTSPPAPDEPHSKVAATPAETSASTVLSSLRAYRVTDGGLNCWKGSRNLLKALWLYCGEGFSERCRHQRKAVYWALIPPMIPAWRIATAE